MKKRLLIPFATLAALGAIFVAGCGGDDDTSSTTGTSGASGVSGAALSQEEFVSQANEICKTGGDALDAQIQDTFGGQQPSDAELEKFVNDVMVPSIQGQIDGVRALVPPEDIADDVTSFLDESEDALNQVQDDPSLVTAGDNNGPFEQSNKDAKALGLTECAG